jgi:hypothetical protein
MMPGSLVSGTDVFPRDYVLLMRCLTHTGSIAGRLQDRGRAMNTDHVPPLVANMNAAFKNVNGSTGATDPALRDMIASRIVELAKDGVHDIEELSTRTLSRLPPER